MSATRNNFRSRSPSPDSVWPRLHRSVRGEFQKNIAAVSEMLKRLPAGAHVSILGVMENSFAQPYFLLSAAVASDGGYFGERLANARRYLEISWRNRSRKLSPTSSGTDLLRAILVASQIFQKSGAQRRSVLVIFPICSRKPGGSISARCRKPAPLASSKK
jgi:hypothetical protein